jgi:phosphoribosylformylglycinamidine synthase
MKTAVIVFPGSNCDRDIAVALREATGVEPIMVWHRETALPNGIDFVALPGGFSFGDYLRCGAIAAQSPIMRAVRAFAQSGGPMIGVCNGWQLMIEAGLLPGALLRNRDTRFICKTMSLRVECRSMFTHNYEKGQNIRVPIAHHDGNFTAAEKTLERLEKDERIAFRYVDAAGAQTAVANDNGSMHAIAGVLSENKRVLGMMPHPERALHDIHGSTDGALLFDSIAKSLVTV